MAALTIAAAQTLPIRGDVGANLEHHVKLAERAAASGAHAVVYPELSLTGYELDLARELAFEEGDARLDSLRELAQRQRVKLVVGAPVRRGSALHIGAFALEPDGAARLYTKHHLHGVEKDVFVAGDANPVVRVADERAALAICADTSHAEHPAAAAAAGAGLYLAGVFFTDPDDAKRFPRYAAEHELVVAMANFGAATGGQEAAGGSAVWSAAGQLIAKLEGSGPGLAIGTRAGGNWSGEAVRL